MVSQTDPRASIWIIHSVYSFLGTMSSLVMFSIVIIEYGTGKSRTPRSVGPWVDIKSTIFMSAQFQPKTLISEIMLKDVFQTAQTSYRLISDGNYEWSLMIHGLSGETDDPISWLSEPGNHGPPILTWFDSYLPRIKNHNL